MLKAAPIFTDHAVLQREKNIWFFGTAPEGAIVTLTLGSLTQTSAPAHNGRWELLLPPLPAGGPYDITLTDGTDTLTLHDIMIGEVWLCGGQSNMELNLKDAHEPEPALDTCDTSNVRLYHVCKRGILDEQFFAEEAASGWQLPSRDTCPYWSAVGYFFAVRLAKKLGVTVGLVNCNYGGTSASAWMSEEMLASTSVGQQYLQDYADGVAGLTEDEANAAYDAYLDYHCKWNEKMMACYAEQPDISWTEILERCGENRYPGPHAPKNPLRPHGLYDTMIRRIIPYTLRGVLYYQGESDENRCDGYRTLLTSLITQWRTDFRDDSLPFLLVQLPIYAVPEAPDAQHWCPIREAQAWAYRNIRGVGLAVILECGEFGNIHPTEKREPARRLYLQALREVYGLQTENTTAPLYRSYLPENGGIRLFFDNAECGLSTKMGTGFEVCGTDGSWHAAFAEVGEKTIFVRSDAVPHPVAARYAWRNFLIPSVFGTNGLPLAPFRTSEAY
ncbi:MAG: sialate O-acetylesterase [Oscillospiraceae bacterium]|nr:sialate O-acetylesterase [Ruminococcus sp.]MBQ7002679.1 sialate O-acetylesterase [Oscillospiraceae bacterium]MBQ7012416.1 sialate O-acetylesterase [Oscillospiraceae bacterium]